MLRSQLFIQLYDDLVQMPPETWYLIWTLKNMLPQYTHPPPSSPLQHTYGSVPHERLLVVIQRLKTKTVLNTNRFLGCVESLWNTSYQNVNPTK